MPRKYTILPLIALLFASCSRPAAEPKAIDRLDLAAGDSLTPPRADEFRAWSEVIGFEGSPAELAASRPWQMFAPEIGASIASLDSVEQVLGHALAGRDSMRLVGVITPYSQAVVTHPDGYVFIGLNHYLGADSEAYAGFPEYLRRRKVLSRMPIDVVQAVIARDYPAGVSDDDRLINRLLYQGALLNAVGKALPEGTTDASLLGMTDEEFAWCEANEARIWQTLIERDLLFSAEGARHAPSLMRPAPASTLINANAPGQAALYIALRIVRSYEHETGTDALPSPAFFRDSQSLVKSKYAPANATR